MYFLSSSSHRARVCRSRMGRAAARLLVRALWRSREPLESRWYLARHFAGLTRPKEDPQTLRDRMNLGRGHGITIQSAATHHTWDEHQKSVHNFLAYRCMHESTKSITSRGRQPSSPTLLNTCMISQRQFRTRSNSGDKDDEDVFDDVESRLMREDYGGDGMYMGDSSYGVSSANFDDYGEWTKDQSISQVQGEEGEGSGDVSHGEVEVSDEDSDADSDEESANEQSDEEFEDERTDEELDELLASTPLFDPPELDEDFGPSERLPEFSFRPEGPVYYPGMEYEPEELDVTRPLPPRKREIWPKEEITVQDVIDQADFRNVRYLTRFIGETGNIIARREFKMRKKSHNRIVKAIKTARFFGLMPYTNMGRPKFVFNEPFDEFSDFYETDEDEKSFNDGPTERNYRRSFGNAGRRNFGQQEGGFGTGQGQRF